MAMNDFNIGFIGGLDGTKSKAKLNQDIDAIKKTLKELELKAKLDPNQVKSLETQLNTLKVNLTDAKFSQSALDGMVSQINNALKGIKIPNINVGGNAGQQIGNNIAQGFKQSATAIEAFKKSLSNAGKSSSEIDNIVKKVQSLNVQIDSLRFSESTNGLMNVNVAGLDEFGNKVKITQTLLQDLQSMQWNVSNTTTSVVSTKELERINNAFTNYTAKLAQFKSTNTNILSGLTQPLVDFESKLAGLKNGTVSIDEVKNAFKLLGTEASKITENFTGQLSKTDAAIRKLAQGDEIMDKLKASFKGLNNAPKEITKELNSVSKLLQNVKNIESKEGRTANWSEAYRKWADEVDKLQAKLSVLQKQQASMTTPQIFKTSELKDAGIPYMQKVSNTIEKQMVEIQRMANREGWQKFEVKGIEEADGKIKALTLTVIDAEGALKQFAMQRAKLQGTGKAQDGLMQVGDVKVLETASQAQAKLAQQTENANAKLQEQVNKIQHSWSDGSYEAKYDSLIAKTRQWVDANDESVISTQKLTTAYNEFNQAASNFAKDGSVKNRDILIQKEEELGRQLKATTNDIKVQNAEWAKSSKVDSLHQKIQEFYDKNTATHRKWGSQLKNMLNETAHGAQVTVTRVNEIEQEFLGVSNAARQAGKLGQSFFGSIKEQASKFIGWFSVTSVVMEGVQSIKKMAQAVIEVDTAMIELTKVSSASSNELKNYFDEAAESAKKLGASVSDVISATADFSRLGYNLKDASVLAEVATLYKNVGDGITIDEASSSIVSTMKAFGIEAENAMQIIDAFNQVGNNFAISSGEIGDALKRSASSLAVGGNSLSEAIGLITAGNTVVQDADIVGTALKSMSLRITSTSAELEAMGEDTEFACETLSDYRDLVMGLTDNKVNIVGDDGEYKSTYEILKDISQVWDDMNSMEQSSLMKALFGVRQANIGASILENFDVAEQAMKSAEESAGSALKEQSNYEKGVQYSLDRLSASWQEFSNHFLDSSFVKGIVDFGNTTINVIDDITSALGSLGTIGLIGGAGLSLKNIGNIKTWINDLRLVSSAIRAADMQVATIGAVDYATALDGLSLKQAQLMLTTQGIVGEEQKQILIQQGLIASSDRISASLVSEALANNGLNKEKQEELLIDLGLMNSKTKELITENAVTESKLRAILAEKGIKGAKADTLVASILQTGQNTKEAISWDVLTTSIKNTTKSLIAFLTTNPLGIAMLAIGIGSAIAAVYDALHTSAEEAKENLEESVSAYESVTEEIKSLETELKTCTERLEELQKLADNGTISVANEEELELLKEQNEELERKIALKQAEQIQKQKDVIEDAQDSLGVTVDSKYKTGGSDNSTYAVDVTPAEEMKLAMKAYKEATDYLANPNVSKGIRSTYEGFQKDASYRITEMYNLISPTIDAYDKLIEAGYTLTSTEQKQYDELKASEDAYLLYNYNINKTIEAFRALNEEEQQNILLERLKKQGLTDEQANAVLNNISEENYDEVWDKDFSFTPPEMTDTTTAEEYGKAYAEAWLAGIDEIIQKDDDKFEDSRTKMISSINDMSEGFEELDKIYASIKDEDPFDFKLLDDDNFKETFGELDTYADFIEQITNNSDDIEACQSAFNNLVTEWINEIGILDNVTEENQKLTVAMLKQMGVSNAEEVATKALEKSKTKLAAEEEFLTKKKEDATITSENLTAATYAEVYALWSESTASEATQQYLAQLALSKLDVQNIKLNTKSDIDNIIALAKAAGTSAEYVNALQSALSSLQSASKASATNTSKNYLTTGTQLDAKINNKAWSEELKAAQEQENKIKQAQQELQNVLSSIQNVSLNPSDFYASVDYTGGSKSNGGSGSSSKDTQEQFDWIEIAISRLQRTITNLGKTVSATWKSWTDRNSALKSQISAVTSEINLQQQAADKYLSLANGVGLSGTYKELVRNGSLNISTITDENTIDAIKKYKEYYENYLSALDAKQDAEDELANLVREDFDMIAKQFDSEISLVEANISTLEAYIDQTEMKGNLVSKNYYSAMYTEEQKNLAYLQQKYDQLSNKLSNGTIVQGSEEFNEMATEIKEVSKAIIESNTALEEYQKTMRELDWEVFDLIEEKIGNVTEESEFLIDLLSNSKLFNDNGSITSQGQATLGLHVANMKVYESQVKDYADELAKLDAQFANDSLDKNYLERREELLELQRDSILAMKSEQQSIQDLWSDGYSKLLDYMQKVSDKYRDMMSQISDTRDFEKSVKSQVEEISRLQNILDSYRNDNSEEGKMHKQEIGEQLEEARETLEETEREQYLKELDIMLTAMMDDAEEWQNARLDDVSGLIQSVVDGVDENASSIEDTLKSEISAVGGTLTTEMQNLWNGADGIKGVVGGVNDTLLCIKTLVQSMVDKSNAEANKNSSNATSTVNPTSTPTSTPKPTTTTQQSSAKAITVGGMINASGALIYDYAGDTSGERQYYRNSPYYRVLGEKNGYLKVRHQSLSSGTTGWFKKSDVKAYKTGGLVDETGLAWLDGTKSKPELVLNSEQTENHLKLTKALETVAKTNMFDAIQSYAKLPQFTTNSSGNKSVEIHFENMTFPYVKNADDFITDLQHSKRFENVVLAITDGKGNLDKYKY